MPISNNTPDSGNPLRVVIVGNDGLSTDATVAATRTWTPLAFSTPTFVSVGTTATNVVNALAGRRGLVLTNTHGSFNVFLAAGAAATANGGIYLAPNGVWTMDALTFTTASINAVAGGASLNLAVQEMT